MKAEIQICAIKNAAYVRIVAESDADVILLKQMEYWSPTFDINKDGKLEAVFDFGRRNT